MKPSLFNSPFPVVLYLSPLINVEDRSVTNGVISGVICGRIRKSENQRRYAHNEDDRRGQPVLDSGAVLASCLVYELRRSMAHGVLGPVLETQSSFIKHHAPLGCPSLYMLAIDIKGTYATTQTK